MRLGLTLPYTDRIPREMTLAFVQAGDRLGYDTVWIAEAYGWDAFTVLTDLANHTERIKLAAGIVNVFSRSPALIAQTAGSLDGISGGRFVLGLGTSGQQVVEGWHGVPFRRGVRRLRETTEIVRSVLRRDRVTYEGEIFHLPQGLKLITHPVRSSIPIYLATLTPAGIALAGEIADGWLPIFFSPHHFSKVFEPELARGAQRAGRSPAELSICVFQPVIVTEEVARGRDSVRAQLALYIGGMGSKQRNYYNRLFGLYGFGAEAGEIQDHYLSGRREEATAAVTDEMVDLVTIIGPIPECRRRLDELAALGVSEVAVDLRVPGDDPAGVLAALTALAPAG
ncbi:MAG: LLM class F420-dependent oxidoreductase [Candidatus Dormibacteraeota bacterium]|uniref:LLM class F420-dependent oxidoreductase n=1 Tax=Candidatus Dormiibacter inghamiae TaxID=3127013 RepID=A0A934K599_9BACT|nr:LLM class F420-dependent oxidoreductase [Candidatus Dormibacteraeota bacterium]MBJ7607007.1 LLM class F420-dependent oxidoreductase [Candidatus Dormibacteraeota bacterium]